MPNFAALNLDNLIKLKKFLQRESHAFHMKEWIADKHYLQDMKDDGAVEGFCETAACLAGSAVLACGTKKIVADCRKNGNYAKISDQLLGFDASWVDHRNAAGWHDLNMLYSPQLMGWPEHVKQMYQTAKTRVQKNKAALALVDWLICGATAAQREKMKEELQDV